MIIGGGGNWKRAAIQIVVATIAFSCHETVRELSYTKTPVLFVHGSGMDSRVWSRMIDHLERAGYPPQYLLGIDLTPNNGSNSAAAAEQIAPAVECLIERSMSAARSAGAGATISKVDIVAHSMGAASSRWYAAKVAPEHVRTLVTLAGSNHGSDALAGLPGDGNREMVPAFAHSEQESSFQAALNGVPEGPVDETPFGIGSDPGSVHRVAPDEKRSIAYVSIFIEPDRYIKPEPSAQLAGAGGMVIKMPENLPFTEVSVGNFRFERRTDHDSLPRQPDVIRLVTEILAVRNE